MGAKAQNELLTESLGKAFELELKTLGIDVEVKLEKTRAGKGDVLTKLKISGKDVRKILSEGEQNAVSLALFLAEIQNQHDENPIVFDDPVTSLDHEIIQNLAEKLTCLSSYRQVIIFTHNILFYNSLLYWGVHLKSNNNSGSRTHHICKKGYSKGNCNNSQGHHIYTYKLEKEENGKTGIILEAPNESCAYYIEKVKMDMSGNYSHSSVAGDLKLAIEHYIDEKILNKQSLVKNKPRKGIIDWPGLRNINSDPTLIDQLKSHWDNLSSRGSHLSELASENQLSRQEFNEIIKFLES